MGEKLSGWIFFSSVMMIIAGIANFLWGIGAVVRDELFESRVLFANLTFWGIVFMVLGAILACAGVAVLNKAQWARWFGIVWVSLSIVFYFAVFWAIPMWSFTAIVLDVLVLYGLGVYGDREELSPQ